MLQVTRAGVLACLLGLAPSAFASGLASLQQAASRCFESPSAARCASVWDLSAQLKQQADRTGALRCYSAVLALEAAVAKASLGGTDAAQQDRALRDTTSDCR